MLSSTEMDRGEESRDAGRQAVGEEKHLNKRVAEAVARMREREVGERRRVPLLVERAKVGCGANRGTVKLEQA